jgi:predicted N-formylglutamate amidohydrolase
MKYSLLLTCEHGGNEVPQEYQALLANSDDVLTSHRGWDAGALAMAQSMSRQLNVPLFSQTVSRLLVEMNRSLDNEQLFSEFTHKLSEEAKAALIQKFYYPYRRSVENYLSKLSPPVLHLSIHSFTPVMNDIVRKVDVGLLFDPSRKFETEVCEVLQRELKKKLKDYQVAFNEPYLGVDDGFTTYLRTKHCDSDYAGIEIEVNQRYVNSPQWKILGDVLADVVSDIVR